MRRKDKEITDRSEMEAILRKAQVCRIALSDGGEPYIVPVNFGFEGDAIFFHCATEGRKLDIIRKNPKVCFEVDADVELDSAGKACDWTFRYRSVIGVGRASIIEDDEAKRKALKVILNHYREGEYEIPDAKLKSVLVVRIGIGSMTGKKSGY
ncbi:MAG: pyridoxamine 5'-phosphate oxidase family protein [Euryarchaeota archaeon]|nr:pyridoxamine 5'-phosphate oxidase family protein [Euryarchaeota archaeon]